ncbi:Hsp20/alpha crystallin family protein [Mycobacterium sp. 236(2023)]|uniref:Hsp20/alpha crystallin family protein n=1 Tax=Mycobacterium sp. 236(2023) TaxID=3038163 RepID=UPI0024154E82|nr:Hsp20/alpha crystallin family protein [Mycobacterium sp. 236(2023)]MDG4667233.1 Hsp20/alpha crystallin family protein [Mycobacterium sp. 236(2023)]
MTQSLQRSTGQTDRWRPLQEFENLYTEMDRLAQSVLGGLKGDGVWVPEADILETESAYLVEVEVPGVWHKDVDVSLNGNELVVTGEVKERKREGLFRRRTRKVGEFEFRATLPGPLRDDEVEASLAHGVLRVYVPKAESSKARKIPVSESLDAST